MLVAALLSLGVGCACGAPLSLTNKTLYAAVSQGEWFVLFHLPTCGACRAMQPAWAELASLLERDSGRSGNARSTSLATVDASDQQPLASRFGAEGFPTMLLVRNGTMAHYEGERTAADMAAWISAQQTETLPLTMPREPTTLEPLLHISANLISFVTSAPAAALLLAATAFSLGILLANALPAAPQYMTLKCPAGLEPGEKIVVRLKPHWWQRRGRCLQVVAPPGITEGQPFFVPLALGPHADVVGRAESLERKTQ